jgi:Tfp pilus assembly protein PilP
MVSGNERTMRSAITVGLGILIAVATPGVRAQVAPSTPNSVKSALQGAGAPAQQAAPAATKPAPQAGKPAGKPSAKAGKKAAGKSAAKPAVKAVEKPATPGTAPEATESEMKQARRDPFESLIGRQKKNDAILPPGKLGLQVSTLRLDGIVRAPNGMIAVVSNPQARTYFLREGDRLYDGSVEKISMDGVSFHEEGKDAFGKPVEHQVNKRLYSSPGEQQ